MTTMNRKNNVTRLFNDRLEMINQSIDSTKPLFGLKRYDSNAHYDEIIDIDIVIGFSEEEYKYDWSSAVCDYIKSSNAIHSEYYCYDTQLVLFFGVTPNEDGFVGATECALFGVSGNAEIRKYEELTMDKKILFGIKHLHMCNLNADESRFKRGVRFLNDLFNMSKQHFADLTINEQICLTYPNTQVSTNIPCYEFSAYYGDDNGTGVFCTGLSMLSADRLRYICDLKPSCNHMNGIDFRYVRLAVLVDLGQLSYVAECMVGCIRVAINNKPVNAKIEHYAYEPIDNVKGIVYLVINDFSNRLSLIKNTSVVRGEVIKDREFITINITHDTRIEFNVLYMIGSKTSVPSSDSDIIIQRSNSPKDIVEAADMVNIIASGKYGSHIKIGSISICYGYGQSVDAQIVYDEIKASIESYGGDIFDSTEIKLISESELPDTDEDDVTLI